MMVDGVRIDELPPETLPTLQHGLAAIKDGETVYYLVSQIADLILQVIRDGAPEALDTLKELAVFTTAISGTVDNHETRLDTIEPIVTDLGTGKQPVDPMLTALAALVSSNGKFLAFSGADTPVLRSILGAVSQVSGNPTGGLFEYGSNANGSFLRLPDGTQFCWHELAAATTTGTGVTPLYVSGNIPVTFPSAFIAAPKFIPYSRFALNSAPWATQGTIVPSTTGASIVLLALIASAQGYPGYLAIGRWF